MNIFDRVSIFRRSDFNKTVTFKHGYLLHIAVTMRKYKSRNNTNCVIYNNATFVMPETECLIVEGS